MADFTFLERYVAAGAFLTGWCLCGMGIRMRWTASRLAMKIHETGPRVTFLRLQRW